MATRKKSYAKTSPVEVEADLTGEILENQSVEVEEVSEGKEIKSDTSDLDKGDKVIRFRVVNNTDASMPIFILKDNQKTLITLKPYGYTDTETLTEEVRKLAEKSKLVIRQI